MAGKTFLTPEEIEKAGAILNPPLMTPDGNTRQVFCFVSPYFSSWLGQKAEGLLLSHPHWHETHPIILGSWARGELSPQSDLDVLFCGDEAEVAKLVESLSAKGVKLRYRMPANPGDWTEGVEIFDVLALLKARPLTSRGAHALYEQQKKIWSRKNNLRPQILKKIIEEKKQRALRYDSIVNFLEPNLKYGPGGLRDIEQALQIYELFAEKYPNPAHALEVLKYYRLFFLSIRHKLHMENGSDILDSHRQFDIAFWLGYKSHKDFMREIQRGLSRVAFYADWVVSIARSSTREIHHAEEISFKKAQDLTKALHNDSGILIQKRVRESMDSLWPEDFIQKNPKVRAKVLQDAMDVRMGESFLVSLYSSRLMDKILPQIRPLVGYVQHDQYHRLTADAHILQANRELKRLFKSSQKIGKLKKYLRDFTNYDWKVLEWTCLYHDLGKGQGKGEDHGLISAAYVESDFKSFGISDQMRADVSWLVRNHLVLSYAAFREDIKDIQLWEKLWSQGVVGKNLVRLAVFTVVDILATNPEAWTSWKAQLLTDLVAILNSEMAKQHYKFRNIRLKKKINISSQVVEEIGNALLDHIPEAQLIEDISLAQNSREGLKPQVFKGKRGQIWVRFHAKEDIRGQLLKFTEQIYARGLVVRHASIHTLPSVGVYDWFMLSTQKTPQQVSKLWSQDLELKYEPAKVVWDSVELISQHEASVTVSFKAKDQKGVLLSAVQILHKLGCDIKNAKVHTWGRQVEDIFEVKSRSEPRELMSAIRQLCSLD